MLFSISSQIKGSNMRSILSIVIVLLFSSYSYAQDKKAIELGQIDWLRNYDEAIEKAKISNKPIFIQFQEVPGCYTCQKYGSQVLSHPIIKEIIENEFIPLAIYNNKGGADAKVLKQFDEPSWNNPVSRIINANGENLITRHAGKYSLSSVASYLYLGLISAGNGISDYSSIWLNELSESSSNYEKAYYSMYCFWSGEAKLGDIEGVVSTSPGFMNGLEVVEVNYDPSKTSKKKISQKVKNEGIKLVMKPSKFRLDKDEQYYLKNSYYKYLPLSPGQRSNINSALAKKGDPNKFLSPQQNDWLSTIRQKEKAFKTLYDSDFVSAWNSFNDQF